MDTYGQFCPVALASEVLTRRWTPLVIRELLCGSTRFNELRRGVPRMSQSLLSKRLDELREAGIVVREEGPDGGHPEYHLTHAGEELRPIVEALGRWGRRWISGELTEDEMDADLLMWDVRRRLDPTDAPPGRTVVEFRFTDQPEGRRLYWLVVEGAGEVDLCWRDPGYPVDLAVETDLATMTGVWVGDYRFEEVLKRREVKLRGPAELRRSFPDWLGLSLFAGVDRVRG
ncbi:MAG: winged helix-turn-helix transcriptional regulator [Candidatus Longimicrobiales bacterium M2_2A_002]